mmetsp:Transcript_30542/g.47813  ORF Transcript_30542/g.47813 Transcript_30542/m.47813 type:complete len:185 (+) Transcript_30542:483-1037(+)
MEVFVGTLSGFDSVDEYFDAQQNILLEDLGKVQNRICSALVTKRIITGLGLAKKVNNARRYCDLSSNDATATTPARNANNTNLLSIFSTPVNNRLGGSVSGTSFGDSFGWSNATPSQFRKRIPSDTSTGLFSTSKENSVNGSMSSFLGTSSYGEVSSIAGLGGLSMSGLSIGHTKMDEQELLVA